jgi:hypothetical protein
LSGEKKQAIIFSGIFIGAVFLLFSNGYSPDKLLYGLDTFCIHLPFAIFARYSIFAFHQLPVWMPNIFMGVPLIASANLIMFYPTNLLYILLPVQLHTVYLFDMILHMALAALGMKLFLGRVGLDKKAAIFGAFAYIFCGMYVSYVYTGHWHDIKSMTMIPYVMYFLNRGVAEAKLRHFLTCSIFMALQILAIGMQIMFYTYIMYVAYFIFLLMTGPATAGAGKIKMSAYFLASTAAIIMFSSLQFLPTMDYMQYSWRSDFGYNAAISMSFPPDELASFILPQLYGLLDPQYWGYEASRAYTPYLGIIPALMLFFAFTKAGKRKETVFFLILSLVFLALSLGGYTPLYRAVSLVPVLNKFRDPSRFLTVFSFTLITLSAMGAHNLLQAGAIAAGDRKKLPQEFLLMLKVCGPVLFLLGLFGLNPQWIAGFISAVSLKTGHNVSQNNMLEACTGLIRHDILFLFIIAGLAAAVIYLFLTNKKITSVIFIAAILAVHFLDMRRIDSRFIQYRDMSEFAGPDPVADVLQKDRGLFRVMDLKYLWFPNRNIYYGLDFFSGYHGVLAGRFKKMLDTDAFYGFSAERAFNIKYHIYDQDMKVEGFKKILDGPIKVFEDTHALPRVYFVDRIRKARDEDYAINILKTDFKTDEAIMTGDVALNPSKEPAQYENEAMEYTPSDIKLSTKTNKDGILILSYMYFPMWKAKIDGKPVPVRNVNFANMGIKLEKGRHTVEFYYDASLMGWCFVLTLLAFIIYIIVILKGI